MKDLGVKEDDIVTICLPNIPEALYLMYGVNQLGAIANIVHPLFTYEQMDKMLNKINSKFVFILDINYKTFAPLLEKGIKVYSCSPAKELPLIKQIIYKKKIKRN